MQITIDSKHDTKEEIEKALELIHLLKSRIGNEHAPIQNSQGDASAFTSMFGSTDIGTSQETQKAPEAIANTPAGPMPSDDIQDYSQLLGLLSKNTNNEEKKEEEPKVEIF